jgi:hypothetical protein
MAHPFPIASETGQLRRLTESGVALYRGLNERDEKELAEVRALRAQHMAEIASLDDVMAHLNETIAQRQARMRGDEISLLPTTSLFSSQQDPVMREARPVRSFPDVIEPTMVQSPASFPETNPDGYCVHCGEAVWRVSVSEASPKGFRHSYGATCNPDNPHSDVADLDERAIES